MRIDLHPADLGGCGHYRVIWPALAVRARCPDVEIRISNAKNAAGDVEYDWQMEDSFPMAFKQDASGVERVVGIDPSYDWPDVMVLQRPLQRKLSEAIPHLKKHGVKVIVEIDDNFHVIHPKNRAWMAAQPSKNPDRNYDHLERACYYADRVTVTTPALLHQYGFGHGVILPNYVPQDYLKMERAPHDGVFVGWSGTLLSHPTDLLVVRGAIASAIRSRSDAKLAVIGSGKGVSEQLGMKVEHASGFVQLSQYPLAMAQLDVGFVPLDPMAFNEAKSWLKGLEMAAVGVPFVASPTGPYRELSELGIGTLASKPKEWEYFLKALIRDDTFRKEQGELYRWRVREHALTIEDHASSWYNAWRGVTSLQ